MRSALLQAAPVVRPGAALAEIAGISFLVLREGALWQEESGLLVVADLHLEKGSAFAERGRGLLPPYDTAATLAALEALIAELDPPLVVALGDSFHDRRAGDRIAPADLDLLCRLQRGRDWLWIAGNHDPDPPRCIQGDWLSHLRLGSIVLRHEPVAGPAPGEIAGHLHPVGKVLVRARAVRSRCVVSDGTRAVLPAFGAYAGGLNVRDKAFAPLFGGKASAFMLGQRSVVELPLTRLMA